MVMSEEPLLTVSRELPNGRIELATNVTREEVGHVSKGDLVFRKVCHEDSSDNDLFMCLADPSQVIGKDTKALLSAWVNKQNGRLDSPKAIVPFTLELRSRLYADRMASVSIEKAFEKPPWSKLSAIIFVYADSRDEFYRNLEPLGGIRK